MIHQLKLPENAQKKLIVVMALQKEVLRLFIGQECVPDEKQNEYNKDRITQIINDSEFQGWLPERKKMLLNGFVKKKQFDRVYTLLQV
jgi:hypothetical protein